MPTRLKRERERRQVTQAELAREIGAPSKTVSRWELGEQIPTAYYQRKLADYFEMPVDGSWFVVADGEELPPIVSVPYAPHPYFVDGEARVSQLRALLTLNENETHCLALSGLRGIGKTQLAVAYVHQFAHLYSTVLWVNASTQAQLQGGLAEAAKRVKVPEARRKKPKQQKLLEEFIDWLQCHTTWLLVLDDVEEESELLQSLLRLQQGHLLLTTCVQAVAYLTRSFPLACLQPGEGAHLLLNWAGLEHHPETQGSVSDVYQEATEVSILLGNLPLAIEQAGAYLRETGCSLSSYRQLFGTRRKELLQERGSIPSKVEYKEVVATTWLLCFEKVRDQWVAASDLLHLIAFLAPTSIPEDIFLKGTFALDTEQHALRSFAGNMFAFNRACSLLLNYSLIKRGYGTESISIHPLVQAVVQDGLEKEEQRFWAEQAIRAVECAFAISAPSLWQADERYLEQARICVQLIDQWECSFEEASHLFLQLGYNVRERGLFAEAESFLLKAKGMIETLYGPDHPRASAALGQLGLLYLEMGGNAHAESVYQRAMKQFEKQDDSSPLLQLYTLATNALAEGAIERSIALCQYLLAFNPWSREQFLYKPYVHWLLASGYSLLQDAQQAEVHHQQYIELMVAILGEDHALVWEALNDVARNHLFLGDLQRSEDYSQRALMMAQKALGPDHAEVGHSLSLLADISIKKGDYQQAERVYLQIVGMKKPESRMGLSERFHSFSALASLNVQKEKYAQAEVYYREAENTLEEAMKKGLTKDVLVEGFSLMKSYAHFLQRSGLQRNIERETRLLLQLGQMGQNLLS